MLPPRSPGRRLASNGRIAEPMLRSVPALRLRARHGSMSGPMIVQEPEQSEQSTPLVQHHCTQETPHGESERGCTHKEANTKYKDGAVWLSTRAICRPRACTNKEAKHVNASPLRPRGADTQTDNHKHPSRARASTCERNLSGCIAASAGKCGAAALRC